MRIHFIAIGGAVMHNLALALHNEGHTVTGSDDEIFEPSRSRLQQKGLLPEETGWIPERIHKGLDVVILGMHARDDNPELQRARELKLKINSFPEYVYEHSKNKKRVVVAGSHGKTSITSMVMHVLKALDKSFDYLVGSHVEGFETMVQLMDDSPVIIIEGDEYLTSALDPKPKFLWYKPHVAVISGIAWDHANVFPTKEIYNRQFVHFIESIDPEGKLIHNADDHLVNQCIEEADNPAQNIPYYASQYRIEQGQTVVEHSGLDYRMQIFGHHNMSNMEAARLICHELGIAHHAFLEQMTRFTGAGKRLEKWFDQDNVRVFRDFAHAPSKLKATIGSVKEQYPKQKLTAIFELHTYSSMSKDFLQEYRHSADKADELIIVYNPEVFAAKKLEPFEESFLRSIFAHPHLTFASSKPALQHIVHKRIYKNCILLFMSSGNFFNVPLYDIIYQKLNQYGS